jgi:hypothetical protein
MQHTDKAAEKEEAAVADERDRFNRLREELANRMAEQVRSHIVRRKFPKCALNVP